ncbi:hypothetical protein [Anaerovibrio slackiae]|uniref:hypothetical protein n=2 Tax=Anaerovibrio slackiae TaxID=2652309 RepID=UPI00386C6BB0|nr:hypothetical protein [Selenomonadaceae bacterium]MBQ5733527.1 hypothetical protein [Selenomonadaceae bacterium]
MSTFDEGFVVTDVGLALQSKQLANGEALKFSRAAYGAGMQPDGTDLRTVTAMVDEKLELEIVKSSVVGNGTVDITVMVDNTNVEAPGFPLTEVAMYAMDGDTEILYAYAYFGDRHGWVPSATDARKIRNTMHFDIVIGRTTQVEVKLSSDWSAFATTEDFEAHKDSENAHPALPHFGSAITNPQDIAGIYCGSEDSKLHMANLSDVREVVLGDTRDMVQSYNSDKKRIDHLERLVGNVYLANEMANIYLDGYDGMIIEPFDDIAEEVDRTVAQVTSVVSGDDSIDVESAEGLIIGAHYQLTDGEKIEEVQVKGINTSGKVQRVILYDNVVNQYTDGRAKLYRSSVAIYNGRAYGGGNTRTDEWSPNETFSGSNTAKDLSATLSFDNSSSFELSGAEMENGQIILDTATIGIALVSEGGGSGTWVRVDGEGDDIE